MAPDDLRSLAREVADTHTSSASGWWDAGKALLAAASNLYSPGSTTDRGDTRDLLAGIATLVDRGPYRAVPLYSTGIGGADLGMLPALQSERPFGPPEEDVFRCALGVACAGEAVQWPYAPVDQERLTAAMRALCGPIGCRTHVLAVVAVHYLLLRLPRLDGSERRWFLRRIAWLLDPRTDDATALLERLTGESDPLVLVGTAPPSPSESRPAAHEPFPLACWDRHPLPGDDGELAGRVKAVRRHRRLAFVDVAWDGRTMQLALPTTQSEELVVGDLLAAYGTSGTTRSGEPTLFADRLDRHEAARSAPDTGLPLHDLRALSDFLALTRPRMAKAGFREVVTPVLTDGYFGGVGRPFSTWAAAAGRREYLRVTTELALVRLLADGVTRCYEIGPSFRNEGLRGQPSKEFLMLEVYAADLDLPGITKVVTDYVGSVAEDERPPRRISFDAAFRETSGVDVQDVDAIRRLASKHTPATAASTDDSDALVRRLWRRSFRQRLTGFTAVHSIPGSASPLIAGSGRSAERVWLYVDGMEVAEISRNERDVDVLSDRLRRQFSQDPYAVHRDYREVLKVFARGVPPIVGAGLSVTRLARIRAARRNPVTAAQRRRRESR